MNAYEEKYIVTTTGKGKDVTHFYSLGSAMDHAEKFLSGYEGKKPPKAVIEQIDVTAAPQN